MDDDRPTPAESVVLQLVKQATRDIFNVCAVSAETLANKVDAGELVVETADACRLLATLYRASAERP